MTQCIKFYMKKRMIFPVLVLLLPVLAGWILQVGDAQASASPIRFNTRAVYFEKIQQGEIAFRTVEVANRSNHAWLIEDVEIIGHDMVFSIDSRCGGQIAAHSSCSIDIEFFPQDFWGDFSAVLQFNVRIAGAKASMTTQLQLPIAGWAANPQ